jgi:putative GTP pyrophosphokinase
MVALVPALPSKGQINRCGEYLARGHALALGSDEWEEWFESEKVADAIDVLDKFRAAHQKPLGIVTAGLRQFVISETDEFPLVSQRLKRVPRIVRKLNRMMNSSNGASSLARLEDIGGCRAVVPDLASLNMVSDHLKRTWSGILKRERDYVTTPNAMGYRAMHFTVEKQGRKIEVQIRTRLQQQWANAIESADSRLNLTLKDGVGPDSMLEYFAAAGDVLYHVDNGISQPADVKDRLTLATDQVVADGYYIRRT